MARTRTHPMDHTKWSDVPTTKQLEEQINYIRTLEIWHNDRKRYLDAGAALVTIHRGDLVVVERKQHAIRDYEYITNASLRRIKQLCHEKGEQPNATPSYFLRKGVTL